MRVHVERRGHGPPLVFTHGIGVTRHTFDALAARLDDSYTTITWDLPAHGDSPELGSAADYDRDRVLDDIDDIVAAEADGAPVLVGHSLGGYLTLAWAVTRPGRARALVVMATGPGFRDPEKREAWNDRSRRNAHRFGVVPEAAEMNLQHDGVVIENLANLALPVLLIVGDQDNEQLVGGMQYLAAKLPDGVLHVLAGGDHAMHESSHADEIAALVRDFVAERL